LPDAVGCGAVVGPSGPGLITERYRRPEDLAPEDSLPQPLPRGIPRSHGRLIRGFLSDTLVELPMVRLPQRAAACRHLFQSPLDYLGGLVVLIHLHARAPDRQASVLDLR
jgi:hypothetical protein